MTKRAIKLTINALGGQGGGVLSGWIVQLAERSGYLVQSTSVPGVAQRTGATVYYVELFPKDLADTQGQAPVLALMPVPGDVDVVLASEIMEAGRAIDRGFVTEQTTLITSTHRVYAIGEKTGMGDARVNPDVIIEAAEKLAKRFLHADMNACAQRSGSIISSVLFGALAGSGALNINRDLFEGVIKDSKRAVAKNMAGFEAGFAAVTNSIATTEPEKARLADGLGSSTPGAAVKPLVDQLSQSFPIGTQELLYEGLKKVVDHQDPEYGALYLDRVERVLSIDQEHSATNELTLAVGKHLALWMAYDDIVRVADLKTRRSRFERFRKDVVAEKDQVVHVSEYMHPRLEEICDLLPIRLANWLQQSTNTQKFFNRFFAKDRRLSTTKLRGFLPLYFIASLKFMRRGSFRYQLETKRIEEWLLLIGDNALSDYALATEIAKLQGLIKGYGDTHARGIASYSKIISMIDLVKSQADPAASLERLRKAALADEEGRALSGALAELSSPGQAA